MNWKAKIIFYKESTRIAVYFEKNAVLIAQIKTYKDARWSASPLPRESLRVVLTPHMFLHNKESLY